MANNDLIHTIKPRWLNESYVWNCAGVRYEQQNSKCLEEIINLWIHCKKKKCDAKRWEWSWKQTQMQTILTWAQLHN